MENGKASLGCGSMIVIALIVLFLGNAKSEEILAELGAVRAELGELRAEVDELKAALDER